MILGASKNRGHAVHRHGRDRAGAHFLNELICSRRLSGTNSRRLDVLRSLTTCIQKFLTKLCDFVVLRINLVLTELIQNALSVCRVVDDDVPDSIRDCRTVCAIFLLNHCLQLLSCETVVTATLSKLCLHRIEALRLCGLGGESRLHVCNLTCVCALLNSGESVCKSHLDIAATVAKLSAEIVHALLNAVHGRVQHLIPEAVVDLVGLIHPRIQATAVAATVADAIAPSVIAEQKQEQKNDPPTAVIAESEISTVATLIDRIAAVASRANKHRCRNGCAAIFIN